MPWRVGRFLGNIILVATGHHLIQEDAWTYFGSAADMG
jgi:hypothetical protein